MSYENVLSKLSLKYKNTSPLQQPETLLFTVAQPFNYGNSGHQRFGASTPEAEGKPV